MGEVARAQDFIKVACLLKVLNSRSSNCPNSGLADDAQACLVLLCPLMVLHSWIFIFIGQGTLQRLRAVIVMILFTILFAAAENET